jgi:hypothetical protein
MSARDSRLEPNPALRIQPWHRRSFLLLHLRCAAHRQTLVLAAMKVLLISCPTFDQEHAQQYPPVMVRATVLAILFLICQALLIGALPTQRSTAENLREEQRVTINGVSEVWRLEWRQQPKLFCPADDELSATCPCTGFTFGEKGAMDLVRSRNGQEVERLSLGKFFPEYGNLAVIPGRQYRDADVDFLLHHDFSGLRAELTKRPLVKVMDFADYDHDGQATEFFIQAEVQSCGHRNGIVIGVSKANPHLHAFGTASHPNRPLQLEPWEWEKLKDSAMPERMMDVKCGDHGQEFFLELELAATPGGIRKITRQYECVNNARGRWQPGQLIKQSTQ